MSVDFDAEFDMNSAPQPTLQEAQTMQKDYLKPKGQEEIDLSETFMANTGGRRHRGSKKAHKGKRHGNASLRAWVTFVKKVQKEEGVSYKEAMTRAKKRKDHGEKWRGGSSNMDPMGGPNEAEDGEQDGGRRRRRRTRGRSRARSRAHKRSRSHRRSRRHH